MSATTTTPPLEIHASDRAAIGTWVFTALAVFTLMIVLGILMRLTQGGQIQIDPGTFYALMTMHGLGMAGTLFSAGLVMLWTILTRYVRPNVGVLWITYALFLLGAVGLLVATLLGGFGAGWYALYPLPFVNPTWPSWSIGITIVSLMLIGLAWLLVQLDMLRAMASRYGAGRLLAWEYFRGEPNEPLPAPILITAVCTVSGVLGTLFGAATLMMYLLKWLTPSIGFDPLLLKNTMFMFGHTIVNVAMYCGVCAVYTILPSYTGRAWGVNRVTSIAWNATLLFILVAYFHHLYMDFAQPKALHYIGQVASYGSAIPATAVTAFGVASQLYRSGLRWSFTPLAFTAGIVGWVIGGVAAVLDSTIFVNHSFHNTLWVPGHFHTYFLVGFVLMLLGFVHHVVRSRAERVAGAGLATMLAGGYGFVSMFLLAGLHSVPRRYASYGAIPLEPVASNGTKLALYGAGFASLFLVGALVFFASLASRQPGATEGAQE